MYVDWEFEDFEDMNPKTPGHRVSTLEHLFRISATNGEFLNIAQELLDETIPSAVCFAQLPYMIVSKLRQLTRPGSSRLFELHFFPVTILINDDGSQSLLRSIVDSNKANGIQCTQILGVVKYWGKRARWYNSYAQKVTPSGLQRGQKFLLKIVG